MNATFSTNNGGAPHRTTRRQQRISDKNNGSLTSNGDVDDNDDNGNDSDNTGNVDNSTTRGGGSKKRKRKKNPVDPNDYENIEQNIEGMCVPLENENYLTSSNGWTEFKHFFPSEKKAGGPQYFLFKYQNSYYKPNITTLRRILNGNTDGCRKLKKGEDKTKKVAMRDTKTGKIVYVNWWDHDLILFRKKHSTANGSIGGNGGNEKSPPKKKHKTMAANGGKNAGNSLTSTLNSASNKKKAKKHSKNDQQRAVVIDSARDGTTSKKKQQSITDNSNHHNTSINSTNIVAATNYTTTTTTTTPQHYHQKKPYLEWLINLSNEYLDKRVFNNDKKDSVLFGDNSKKIERLFHNSHKSVVRHNKGKKINAKEALDMLECTGTRVEMKAILYTLDAARRSTAL